MIEQITKAVKHAKRINLYSADVTELERIIRTYPQTTDVKKRQALLEAGAILAETILTK